MHNERRPSPLGTSAVRGRTVNFEIERRLKEIFKQHPEIKTLEYNFEVGEELVRQGTIGRDAYLVIEGTLVEQHTVYVNGRGHRTLDVCEVPSWGIGFGQALVAASAQLPARVSLVAKTPGRAFMVDADWLANLSKIDKIGLMMMGLVLTHDQMITTMSQELSGGSDLDVILADLQQHPDSRGRPEDLKKRLIRKLQLGTEAERKAADLEIRLASLEEDIEKKYAAEIAELTRQRDAAEARAKEAAEGSRLAYEYIDEEVAQRVRSAVALWKLFERGYGREGQKLPDDVMQAILGMEGIEDPNAVQLDLANAAMAAIDEIMLPLSPPPPALPQPVAPVTRRSSSFHNLPSMVDESEEEDTQRREVTKIGIDPPVQKHLPPKKPLGRTGFSGLTPAIQAPVVPPRPVPPPSPRPMPQSARSSTPLGVKPPTLPPPVNPVHRPIVAPTSQKPSDAPDIEIENDRKTWDIGIPASELWSDKK